LKFWVKRVFLSRVKPDVKFDRGCREVPAVAELKAVRDSSVHPKVRKQVYFEEDWCSPDFGETNLLKVPRSPRLWPSSHAVLVLKSANDSFNLFFLSWCKFDTNTVCEILLSSGAAGIPATASITI
jgi:hypothetical protein